MLYTHYAEYSVCKDNTKTLPVIIQQDKEAAARVRLRAKWHVQHDHVTHMCLPDRCLGFNYSIKGYMQMSVKLLMTLKKSLSDTVSSLVAAIMV